MTKTFDYYFDFGSPASYLAFTQLPKLAEQTGATAVYKPMLLGGVFQATGNQRQVHLQRLCAVCAALQRAA
jgi:2-hydroxychromene-2-carboxylate isomerase